MSGSISRNDAIALLCDADLKNLTPDERAEQLEIMTREDWASDPQWLTIPADVRSEIENQDEIEQPTDARYDPVLRLWLQGRYAGARNEFLASRLQIIGHDYPQIIGGPAPQLACPCCGACTLGSRGDYEICRVCWWEDDGQDNHNANKVMGGPNYQLSLTRGRINYLVSGISDPSRNDLRELQEPSEKYVSGRSFVLSDDGRSVSEPSTEWQASLDDEVD